MKFAIRHATIVACAAVLAAGSNSAFARTSHHHHHHRSAHSHAEAHRHHHHHQVAARGGGRRVNPYYSGPGSAPRYAMHDAGADSYAYAPASERSHRGRARTRGRAESIAAVGGFGSSALVADARRYLGSNPTGRRRLWCGAFMDKVLRDTGHPGGGNLAKGYLHYGRRISGPRVGAIAVMGRRGGGHVGVVSGIDANGNPIIISGNHNDTVAEATYPRRRIIAYVMPGG